MTFLDGLFDLFLRVSRLGEGGGIFGEVFGDLLSDLLRDLLVLELLLIFLAAFPVISIAWRVAASDIALNSLLLLRGECVPPR